MRGNKFEKSHILISESETLSRESRVTESAQEIVDSIPCNCEWYSYINSCQLLYTFSEELNFTRMWGFYLEFLCLFEELVEVSSRLSDSVKN